MDIVQIKMLEKEITKKLLVADIDKDLSLNGQLPADHFTFFRFRQNDKYGYYPMMKTGKYKKLDHFTGHFARFTIAKRKKGWIDINGNEYLD